MPKNGDNSEDGKCGYQELSTREVTGECVDPPARRANKVNSTEWYAR